MLPGADFPATRQCEEGNPLFWSSLERYRDHGLLVLRVGFGLGLLWYHGWDKLVGGPERWAQVGGAMELVGIGFAPAFWGFLAALAESVGGVLSALGFLFRPAALAIAFVMVMATVQHMVTGQGTPAHSFKNIWVFVGLLAIGPGRFSVDRYLSERRKGKEV